MMKTLLSLLFCLIISYANAQTVPTDTVPAIINYTTENGVVKFSSELRPLRQIAGAPAPFYTYFWEFGDGGFSFEKNPSHIFKDTSAVKVRLYATNNYDDGKRPPTRPKLLKPTGKPATKMLASNNTEPVFFKTNGNIELKANCMPKPGDDMMLVFGYRNKIDNGQQALNGTISVLYNDTEFAKNNFELVDVRTYNNEQKTELKPLINYAAIPIYKTSDPSYYASVNEIPLVTENEKILLKDKIKDFKNHESFKFDNLKQNEERFVFMHLKTTPEMIKDTNAVVRISAVFIPDNVSVEPEFFNMELQIVASHDPNKMVLRKSRMNYRFTGKNRALTYKVRFQNTGKGPAKKVAIAVSVADVFDQRSIEVISTKPEVIACENAYANQSCLKTIKSTRDSVYFVFNNIYLPGLDQQGVNNADSTMGFVEYKINFKKKPKKLPIKTAASIVFDKNEAIHTNRAVGRFKMGLSPGIILGYGFPFETDNSNYLNNKNTVIGLSLAPYAPHRSYWQVEVYLNNFSENSYSVPSTTIRRDTLIGKISYLITKKDFTKSNKVLTINAVPLQYRYNLNRFIGAGAGTLVSLDVYNKNTETINYKLTPTNIANQPGTMDLDILASDLKSTFSNARVSFFADVQLGLVHTGPSIGFRYMYDPKTNTNRMGTYLTWKF